MRTGRFERADRLLRWRDFDRVTRFGRRTASRDFVVLVMPPEQMRGPHRARLGIIVGRRVGNAIARNHVKRAVREWFRRSRGRLEQPAELVVIARRGAAGLSVLEIGEALDEIVFSRQGS
jgi:ribonuclease P protein component